MLADLQFKRYVRQISVPDIAESGQQGLLNSHVLIIGCGGLGTAASLYLAGAGIGRLVIADQDVIELSNLPRQIAYRQQDVGSKKTEALKQQLMDRNPEINVRTVSKYLDGKQLSLEVSLADIVLDCSDNMRTRQAINKACYMTKTDLVSGAAIGWGGQISVFRFNAETSIPCYRCLYPFDELASAQRCSESGIIGPVVGMIGVYQALETIKLAGNVSLSASPKLKIFDGLNGNWRSLNIQKDPTCTVCCNEYQEGKLNDYDKA
ncbi:HesA/MoeB/ThiF family protein [Vibrio sp. E150_011]|uniref:HesA/MoeB/ThiF family protein n=1 Tax=Vibrio sp. 10N.261.51.F12 TaxID=3229679 RepID=UPI00354FB877